MILHELFCDADDFCQEFIPVLNQTLLEDGKKKRRKSKCLYESEIITLVIKVPNERL